jgi:riboflavin kinase/FMN adenylyltransferase
MKVIRGLSDLAGRFVNPVVTLGNFDGVHLGHQAILRTVVARAREIGGTAVAFTFEPHPLKVLAPERSPLLLNTFEGKVLLFEAAGIDVVIAAEFTRSFAEQHPEDFVRDVLHAKIGAVEVYVGYNYAFGKGRKGGIDFLRAMGGRYGFSVGVVEAVEVDGRIVSSSVVRDLVSAGRVAEAARLLGRSYAVDGEVVHGDHRGHDLGFPTANVNTANELLPAYGVYAVQAVVEGRVHSGAASIGVRPTFGGGPVSVEVYLFDFTGDLYGKRMDVRFIKRLRGEQRFPDRESLVRQMRLDVEHAKQALTAAGVI